MPNESEKHLNLLKDKVGSDNLTQKRLQYLESFFRNIIRLELEKYSKINKYEKK